jgi:hypothetical protein
MVNQFLGPFLSQKVAKAEAASLLRFFVVLVLDDPVPTVRYDSFK